MSDPDEIRWLKDRELIRELPQRYAYGIDTRDWSLVRAQFADDCRVEGNMGEAPIEPYLERLRPGVEAYPATMHFMGNQYVRIEADSGHVETYAVAYHMEADDSPIEDLVLGVRYCDDVARTPDGWRIRRRRVLNQWRRGPMPRPA